MTTNEYGYSGDEHPFIRTPPDGFCKICGKKDLDGHHREHENFINSLLNDDVVETKLGTVLDHNSKKLENLREQTDGKPMTGSEYLRLLKQKDPALLEELRSYRDTSHPKKGIINRLRGGTYAVRIGKKSFTWVAAEEDDGFLFKADEVVELLETKSSGLVSGLGIQVSPLPPSFDFLVDVEGRVD